MDPARTLHRAAARFCRPGWGGMRAALAGVRRRRGDRQPGSGLAFPPRIGGIRLGVPDLYRTTTGALAECEVAHALSFADATTAMLLHVQAHAAGLERPLDSLTVSMTEQVGWLPL
jgi:hypothetical protein